MKQHIIILIGIICFAFFLSGCTCNSDKFPVIGKEDSSYKLLDAPQIAIAPAGYSGKKIKIILTFKNERQSDKDFYRVFLMTSGSPFYIYVKRGKYTEMLNNLKVGTEYMIYGLYERDMVAQQNFIYVD